MHTKSTIDYVVAALWLINAVFSVAAGNWSAFIPTLFLAFIFAFWRVEPLRG